MSSYITFSKYMLACDAVDTVRADYSVCFRGRSVCEMKNNTAVFTIIYGPEAFIEVCTFRRHPFDEFIEELSAMYALQTARDLVVTDELTFVFAFALMKKEGISTLSLTQIYIFRECTVSYLRTRTAYNCRRETPTCLMLHASRKIPKRGVL